MIENSRPVVALIRLIGWLTSAPSRRAWRREQRLADEWLARNIAQARAAKVREMRLSR